MARGCFRRAVVQGTAPEMNIIELAWLAAPINGARLSGSLLLNTIHVTFSGKRRVVIRVLLLHDWERYRKMHA